MMMMMMILLVVCYLLFVVRSSLVVDGGLWMSLSSLLLSWWYVWWGFHLASEGFNTGLFVSATGSDPVSGRVFSFATPWAVALALGWAHCWFPRWTVGVEKRLTYIWPKVSDLQGVICDMFGLCLGHVEGWWVWNFGMTLSKAWAYILKLPATLEPLGPP